MDIKKLQESVLHRYSSDHDLEYYRNRAGEGLREWERRIVEQYMSPGRVLSIGCGGGRECFGLEGMGYSSVGIDISKEQINNANRAKADTGSRADFLVYDGATLPFGNDSFTSATIWSQVLGNVPGSDTRVRFLKECRRVLANDGVLSLSVHDCIKTMALIMDSDDTYSEIPGGDPGDLMLDTASDTECYWHYFERDEVELMCKSAGFESVDLYTSDELGQDWDNLIIAACF